MNDVKKTELWNALVTKHTAAAKAQAEGDGNVAKETTPLPAGDPPPADTPAQGNDQLVALMTRIDALEAKLAEVGKSIGVATTQAIEVGKAAFDVAVAKAADDSAVAKAELDKNITDAKALVADAKAAADRIEALAPRGTGKRIDEIGKDRTVPAAKKTEAELLAENAPNVLKMAPGAK